MVLVYLILAARSSFFFVTNGTIHDLLSMFNGVGILVLVVCVCSVLSVRDVRDGAAPCSLASGADEVEDESGATVEGLPMFFMCLPCLSLL